MHWTAEKLCVYRRDLTVVTCSSGRTGPELVELACLLWIVVFEVQQQSFRGRVSVGAYVWNVLECKDIVFS